MSESKKAENQDQFETGYFVTFKVGLPDEYRSPDSGQLHEDLNISVMKALEPIIAEHPALTLTHNISIESLEPTRLI